MIRGDIFIIPVTSCAASKSLWVHFTKTLLHTNLLNPVRPSQSSDQGKLNTKSDRRSSVFIGAQKNWSPDRYFATSLTTGKCTAGQIRSSKFFFWWKQTHLSPSGSTFSAFMRSAEKKKENQFILSDTKIPGHIYSDIKSEHIAKSNKKLHLKHEVF